MTYRKLIYKIAERHGVRCNEQSIFYQVLNEIAVVLFMLNNNTAVCIAESIVIRHAIDNKFYITEQKKIPAVLKSYVKFLNEMYKLNG